MNPKKYAAINSRNSDTDKATRSVSALTMRRLSPLSLNMKNNAENRLASMQMRTKMTKYRRGGKLDSRVGGSGGGRNRLTAPV